MGIFTLARTSCDQTKTHHLRPPLCLTGAPQYYLQGFFDDETGRIECAENPFSAKVLPMSPV
jgi:hypothetical protein